VGIVNLGRYGLATRDCPNVIVPTLANPISPVAGVSWATGAYKSIVTAAAPLGYDLLLTGAVVGMTLGDGGTADKAMGGGTMLQLQFASGAAPNEANLAETQMCDSFIGVVAGLGVGGSWYMYETNSRSLLAGPAIFPNAVRISGRASISNAPGFKSIQLYLTGYDVAALDFAPPLACPANSELLERGCRPAYSDLMPLGATVTVVPAGSWGTPGDWVQVPAGATLEGDYLVTGGYAIAGTTSPLSAQFDVGLGTDTPVLQARFPMICTGTYGGSTFVDFKYSFIAYSGETMKVRASSPADGATENFLVGIRGVRLS